MRAVWSFWSKPFLEDPHARWSTPFHHLLGWILSIECARRHYPDIWMITDSFGAELFSEHLGIDFSLLSTDLDAIHNIDTRWWAAGKLYAYTIQDKPFVHIDNDVFLWNRLPHYLEFADVLGQNPEFMKDYFYDTRKFGAVGGWVPEEISEFQTDWNKVVAVNCGIFGGCNVEFIRYCAHLSLDMIFHKDNKEHWLTVGCDCPLLEQCVPVACHDYFQKYSIDRFGKKTFSYLFRSFEEAFNSEISTRYGYTHLIAGSKKNSYLTQRLEKRVKNEYPELFERCKNFVNSRFG